jgi:hypothetical protein
VLPEDNSLFTKPPHLNTLLNNKKAARLYQSGGFHIKQKRPG